MHRAGSEPNWESTCETHDGLYLAYSLFDAQAGSLYIGLNPHHYTIGVSLPPAPGGQVWRRAADTSLPPPLDFTLEPGSGAQAPGAAAAAPVPRRPVPG